MKTLVKIPLMILCAVLPAVREALSAAKTVLAEISP